MGTGTQAQEQGHHGAPQGYKDFEGNPQWENPNREGTTVVLSTVTLSKADCTIRPKPHPKRARPSEHYATKGGSILFSVQQRRSWCFYSGGESTQKVQ